MLLLGLLPSVLGGVSWLLGGRKSPPGGQEVLSLSPSLGLGEGRKGRSHMHPGGSLCYRIRVGKCFCPFADQMWSPLSSLQLIPLCWKEARMGLEAAGVSEVFGVGVAAITSLFVFHLQPPAVA